MAVLMGAPNPTPPRTQPTLVPSLTRCAAHNSLLPSFLETRRETKHETRRMEKITPAVCKNKKRSLFPIARPPPAPPLEPCSHCFGSAYPEG